MATSFKRSHAHTAALSAHDLQQASTVTHLHWRLLDTHGFFWISLLWVHCSFLLCPGIHKVLFVPSKSLFPQSYVSSGGSIMGLMETSSKRAYAIPRSTAPWAPAPAAGHCWPIPPQEILRVLAQSVWVGCVFCAIPNSEELRRPDARWVHCPWWAMHPTPWFRPLIFLSVLWKHHLRCAICLLWRADLRLWPAWWLSTIQDLRKTWLAAGSLFSGGRCHLWGGDCSSPLPSGSGCCKPSSLSPGREGLLCSRLALLWYSLNPLFCERARLCVRLLG